MGSWSLIFCNWAAFH